MLVWFGSDQEVYPIASETFGEMDEHKQTLSMRETRLYKEDWIGLKKLDQQGRVKTLEVPGAAHLQYPDELVLSHLVPFLYPEVAPLNFLA